MSLTGIARCSTSSCAATDIRRANRSSPNESPNRAYARCSCLGEVEIALATAASVSGRR